MSSSNLQILGRALRLVPDLLRSGPDRRFTAADLLERQARRRPEAPFVRFEGRTVSYRELNAQANRFAHWALARGLRRGDVVALLMENRPEYIAVWIFYRDDERRAYQPLDAPSHARIVSGALRF